MGKRNVTTRQLESLVQLTNTVYRRATQADPDRRDEWRVWRDDLVTRIHAVVKPSARPYAGRVVAEVAGAFGERLVDALTDLEAMRSQLGETSEEIAQHRARAERLKAEGAALREEIARLRARQARRPHTREVTIPARTVAVRSELQEEILRLMGAEGLGRSWRIRQRVVEAGLVGNPRSVRNALRKLSQRGLIDDYRRHGEPVRWSPTPGGSRRLLVLTEVGKAWYREAFGEEPVESEIAVVARKHRSVAHGVGVLEARDHLRAAGYEVDEEPEAILARVGERWGRRAEPDLVVMIEREVWPVEVQREVSERVLGKWAKTLRLVGRLALVLFNEQGRAKQERLLGQAMRTGRLARGSVLLTSLEAMERGEWRWSRVGGIGHR
ncbi:MAG TPA: hypothetical protein ENK56_04650 [Chloroflexi bacterium]|nr:hypothetical protein [Chloroflexota bacterium]